MAIHRWSARLAIVAAILAGWLTPAAGQVLDEAKFFSPEAALQADRQLRQLGKTHNLTLIVETFAQPPADIAEELVDKNQRARAFARWAETRRAAHHAHLYILICRKPGRVEIALHESLARRFPKEKLGALRDTLVQRLRDKRPDEALREGVSLMEQVCSASRVDGEKSKPGGVAVPADPGADQPSPEAAQEGGDWTWVIWAILIGVGVIIAIAIIRGLFSAMRAPTMQPGGPPVAGPGAGPGPGSGGYVSGGQGGGFLGSFLAGAFGAAVGSWIYDRFFRTATPAHAHEPGTAGGFAPAPAPVPIPDDPTARYAPEAGQTITTGGDFDAEPSALPDTGADTSEDDGLDDTGGGWETGEVGGADFEAETGGDFDAGGDFGGDYGDFGGDV